MKKLMLSTAAMAAAAFMAVAPAQAGTVSLEQAAAGAGLNVFGATNADRMYRYAKIQNGDDTLGVYAGAFRVTHDGTDDEWLAFCVDLFQNYNLPADYTRNAGLFGTSVVDRLDKLFTNYFDKVTSDNRAAAFQVAVWEIVSDSDLDITDGVFKVLQTRDRVVDLTNKFLTGLDDLDGGGYDLTFLESGEVQDLVIADLTPVPLPATGLLLLAGLGAMGAMRRKAV